MPLKATRHVAQRAAHSTTASSCSNRWLVHSLPGARAAVAEHPQSDPLNIFVSKAKGPQKLKPLPVGFAVKDNIATGQLPTSCGSSILQDYISPLWATVIQQQRRCRDPVYTVIGKTNMDEFGMGSHSTNSSFGAVRSSYDKYSAGGSSGGSAVAVATGLCSTALGTDTGGSVRLPAAYTGIVGFKPSYGMISRYGVVPYANSLDTVGLLASSVGSVAESALLASHDDKDPTSATSGTRQRAISTRNNSSMIGLDNGYPNPYESLKVGIPIEYNITELDPVVRKAWIDVLEALQSKGCTIVPISLPTTKHALSAYYIIAAAEAASNLSKYDGIRYGMRGSSTDGAGDVLYSETRGQFFGDETKRRILLGSYTLSSSAIDNYFIKAQKIRRLVQRDFDRIFLLENPLRPRDEQFDLTDIDESIEMGSKLGPSQVDFILCPTAPTRAPTLKSVGEQTSVESYMNDVFTVPASLAGVPAISVPWLIEHEIEDSKRPPFVGIQIIGQYSDDLRVLAAAKLVEKLQDSKMIHFPRILSSTKKGDSSKTSSMKDASHSAALQFERTEVKVRGLKDKKSKSVKKTFRKYKVFPDGSTEQLRNGQTDPPVRRALSNKYAPIIKYNSYIKPRTQIIKVLTGTASTAEPISASSEEPESSSIDRLSSEKPPVPDPPVRRALSRRRRALIIKYNSQTRPRIRIIHASVQTNSRVRRALSRKYASVRMCNSRIRGRLKIIKVLTDSASTIEHAVSISTSRPERLLVRRLFSDERNELFVPFNNAQGAYKDPSLALEKSLFVPFNDAQGGIYSSVYEDQSLAWEKSEAPGTELLGDRMAHLSGIRKANKKPRKMHGRLRKSSPRNYVRVVKYVSKKTFLFDMVKMPKNPTSTVSFVSVNGPQHRTTKYVSTTERNNYLWSNPPRDPLCAKNNSRRTSKRRYSTDAPKTPKEHGNLVILDAEEKNFKVKEGRNAATIEEPVVVEPML